MRKANKDLSINWAKLSLTLLRGSSKVMTPIEFAKAIGVDLYPKWKDITLDFFDPKSNYKELIACAGMKGGKTYMAGFYSNYEMYLLSQLDNPAQAFNLDPDSWIYGICAARNRLQAKEGVFAEFAAKAKRCGLFDDLEPVFHSFSFELKAKKLRFVAGPSNSDALVSHTLAFAVLDEMSLFKTAGGERSARSVYEAVSHQLGLLDGRLYVISSPQYKQDWTMQLLEMAKQNARMFGIQEPTWNLNPNMPRNHPKIVDAYQKNPEGANRDYGAEPSLALEPFFAMPNRIDLCINYETLHPLDAHNVPHEWFSPVYNTAYALAGDPAVKNNAFGFVLAHREGLRYIIDLMHRFYNPVGEIDATEPRSLFDRLKELGFPIVKFGFDTWQFPETIQYIRNKGADTIKHIVDLEAYSFLKELIYGGNITLYNHPYAIEELKSLELIKGSKVDHRSGFSKDIADCIAQACWLLRTPYEEAFDTKILRA